MSEKRKGKVEQIAGDGGVGGPLIILTDTGRVFIGYSTAYPAASIPAKYLWIPVELPDEEETP